MYPILTILSFILVPLASPLGPDLVIEVSRHGARAPLNLTYDTQGYWTSLQGQLTGVGMRMSYILGAAYREDYPDLLNLYDPSNIYARSTDTDYSIMGAYSKLFGVYNGTGPGLEPDYPAYLTDPPFNDTLVSEVTRDLDNSYAIPYNFQPVPVHIVEMKYDTVLMGAGPACPQSKQWITANSEDYEVSEIYRKYMQDVVNHLRRNNINVNSFGDLYVFADLATANKHEDITIPGDIKAESPYYKNLKFAYEWYTTKLYQNLNIQKQLNALNLLTYVVDVMDDKASGTSNLKFAFMSGHDSTILAVLSAFNITNKDCLLENYLAEKQGKDKPYPLCMFPKFTSNLKFELYDSAIPTVKFFFNDVLVEICGSGNDCNLDEFEDYVKKVTNSYTVQDYNALCGLKSQQKKTSQSSSRTTVIMLGALTVVLAVGLSMICYQKKKGQTEGDVGGGYRIQA